MSDDPVYDLEFDMAEDEEPLMVFVMTTYGMHAATEKIVARLDVDQQVLVVRDAVVALRKTADSLEARAGLAAAVEEAMKPMA